MASLYTHKCVLCSRDLSIAENKIAQRSDVSRLISYSEVMGDDIRNKLRGFSQIAVHSMCYKSYIGSAVYIAKQRKRVSESEPNSQNADNPPKKQKLTNVTNHHNTPSSEDIQTVQNYSTFEETMNNSTSEDIFLKNYLVYEEQRRYQILEAAAWYIRNDIDAMYRNNQLTGINFYDDRNNLPDALEVLLRSVFAGANHFENLQANYIPIAQIFLFAYLLGLARLRNQTE